MVRIKPGLLICPGIWNIHVEPLTLCALSGARGRPARITAAQAGGSDTNGGRGPGSGWSLDESLGWFDEPDADWKYRKSHVKEQLKFRKFYPENSTQHGLY